MIKTSISAIFAAAVLGLTANGQCYTDRHNNSWNEGWLSCEQRLNPNTEHGQGHWILYDFGHAYALGEVQVWNYNAADYLSMGMREVIIETSMDGQHWHSKGQHVLEQASGKSRYEGETVLDFGGDTARYVLITALNNYGGGCTGLSEVKFNIVSHVDRGHKLNTNGCFNLNVYPNPHVEQVALQVRSRCDEPISYQLFDHTGRMVLQGRKAAADFGQPILLNTEHLSSGIYHLVVEQGEHRERIAVAKTKR